MGAFSFAVEGVLNARALNHGPMGIREMCKIGRWGDIQAHRNNSWDAEILKATEAELARLKNSTGGRIEPAQLEVMRLEITAQHRIRIEREKEKRAKVLESQALAQLKRCLVGYGIKRLTQDKLDSLSNYIKNQLFPSSTSDDYRTITDGHLRCIVKKVGDLSGINIASRVALDYEKGFGDCVRQWVSKVADDEQISRRSAQILFDERVRFVAVYGDGMRYPIESAILGVHDAEDSAAFRRVAPTDATRAEIRLKLSAERESAQIRLREAYLTRKIAAAPQPGSSGTDDVVSQAELMRRLKLKKKHWLVIRDDVKRECPPVRIIGKKNPQWSVNAVDAFMKRNQKKVLS